MINRRGFLGSLASCAAFAGGPMLAVSAETVKKFGKPDLRFGVLSDVHLYWSSASTAKHLKIALEHFREADVDAVLIAGDIATSGRIPELKVCAKTWQEVFPDNRGRDGRKVEKLFIAGNHDVTWYGAGPDRISKVPENERKDLMTADVFEKAWSEAFGEKYEPIWMKRVKGYAFIGAHWRGMKEFPAFLKAHAAELAGKKPFFYTQHAHPKDTCMGAWAWGHDNGDSTKALSEFPNAVAFSGHSHYSLTDERSVWQGAFTSINTASLNYMSSDYSLRENFVRNDTGYQGEKRQHVKEGVGSIAQSANRQGMIVSVHGTTLVIERYDAVERKVIGDNWVLRIPGDKDMSFAARAAKRSAPAFAPDAKITVKVEEALVKLTFPAAHAVNKCRVYEYELTATLVEDDVDLVQAQRRMMALDAFRPEEHPGQETPFAFARAELPMKGHYRFSVRPLECFGKKGEPLVSETVVI